MKFASSLLTAALVFGASTAFAGSDDGTADRQPVAQPLVSQAPAPAAAPAQQAEVYSGFEHQAVQP